MSVSIRTLIALAGLSLSPLASAVTVGNDAACDFATLNEAINSVPRGGSVNIRLSNNTLHDPLLSIDRNVIITGGYDNCSDATANHLTRSVIRGIGNNQPTVHLSGFANPIQVSVVLTNVRVTNGGAPNGAGLRITGDNQVTLSNVEVVSNVAGNYGGGVYLDGRNGARLIIDHDSVIRDNQATNRGGGVYCIGGNSDNGGGIDFRRGMINNNLAGAYGAGVFLDACEMVGSSSGYREIAENFTDREAFDDEAADINPVASGGGLYAANDSRVLLGSRTSETWIRDNRVRNSIHNGAGFHYEENHGRGGGLVSDSRSNVELVNARIVGNLANSGGGVRVQGNAQFSLSRDPAGCIADPLLPGCASLHDNVAKGYDTGFDACVRVAHSSAGQGGAIHMNSGTASLNGVHVTRNEVTQTSGCVVEVIDAFPHGSAFYVSNGAVLDAHNSVLHENGHSSADDLIHVTGNGSRFRAFHSTLAANSEVDDALLRTSDGTPSIGLYNSVVVDSARFYANDGAVDGKLDAACVLGNNLSSLEGAPQGSRTQLVQASNAGFVDGANDNFSLRGDSPAVDLCSGEAMATLNRLTQSLKDLSGSTRPRANGGDASSSFDAGAYELATGAATKVADLSVTLDDGGFVVGLNQSMGYIIRLHNDGPDTVSNAGFRLTLDSRMQNAMALVPFAGNWTCSHVGRIGTCTLNDPLAPGQTSPQVVAQFTSPSAPGVTTSSAEVLLPAATAEVAPEDNQTSLSSSIASNSDLRARFSFAPALLQPGVYASTEVALHNLGPDVSLAPRVRVFLPSSATEFEALNTPSSAWTCGNASDQGNGTAAITCAANQAGVGEYRFQFGYRLPTNLPTPSIWTMRVEVAQDTPEPVGNNIAEVGVPVENLGTGPMLLIDGFED